MSPETRSTDVKINLRMTNSLHRRLKQQAKTNNATLQREITRRLEESLSSPRPELVAIIKAAAQEASDLTAINLRAITMDDTDQPQDK